MTKPRKPIISIDWTPLDLDADVGRYKIDTFAGRIMEVAKGPIDTHLLESILGRKIEPPGGLIGPPWPLDALRLRELFNDVTEEAVAHAQGAENDATFHFDAREHMKELTTLGKRAAIISGRDIAPFETAFDGNDDDEAAPARQRLMRIGHLAAQLSAEIDALRIENPVGHAINPRNKTFLQHHFVTGSAYRWRMITGAWPPNSRTGLFVDLLVAAWRDLGFPEPDEIAGPLGDLAKAHPHDLRFED